MFTENVHFDCFFAVQIPQSHHSNAVAFQNTLKCIKMCLCGDKTSRMLENSYFITSVGKETNVRRVSGAREVRSTSRAQKPFSHELFSHNEFSKLVFSNESYGFHLLESAVKLLKRAINIIDRL